MGMACRAIVVLSLVGLILLKIVIGIYLNVDPSIRHVTDSPQQNVMALDDSDDEIFIFVHISDLHISKFTDNERYEQLKEFCGVNLKAINPRLVLASGDLTDSIAPDRVIATQFEEEWKMYQELYSTCRNVSGVPYWLDLRGNHDNFNVDGYNSYNSFYPKFGAKGSPLPGSYMVTIEATNNTKYAFVGVDATLDLGPKRILNFVGQLDDYRLSKLQEFENAIIDSKINASIWFGHYPTSSIFLPGLLPGLRHVAANGIAYLCGHFHTFGGIVPQMYSHHHSGMLELELADWKHNRMFRVAVLDHGLFSFADVKHKSWPIIVVTNPKPLITTQPSKEPVSLMTTSTHIRLLIFSPLPIDVCEVKLDDGDWKPCKRTGKKHPLYTVPWQPSAYSSGVHVLEVRAKDSNGSESLVKIDFALDKTPPYFPLLGRVALMTDLTTVCKTIFIISILACIVPFYIMRYVQNKIVQRRMKLCRFRNRWIRLWIRKFWIFANINSLFYPFLVYTLYLAFGPWFVGDLIDGRMGVVFVWGTYFEGGTYLSGTMTYFNGFLHVFFFNLILVVIIAHAADVSFQEVILKKQAASRSWWRKITKFLPIAVFITFHTITCYLFWLSYGNLATFINPMRTWSLLFAAYLWFRAQRLGELELTNVAKTWN